MILFTSVTIQSRDYNKTRFKRRTFNVPNSIQVLIRYVKRLLESGLKPSAHKGNEDVCSLLKTISMVSYVS